MFKHAKVVPITAATPDSRQQSKEETIPFIGATANRVSPDARIRPASRHASAAKEAATPRIENVPRKILYMPKRSPADSCNT
jgi:hypothetical protein